MSTTPDNQILVELGREDTFPANLFDLNGRTVVFTPDGHGGYSRSVQSVLWEDDIGRAVEDGTEIQLDSFMFDFADRRWGSFFVSRRGLITFGEPPTYVASRFWFVRMSQIASEFVTAPTISPLFKLFLGGEFSGYGATQHVSHRPDRVVVTWITTDPDSHVHGVPPEQPARFQAVLGADGSIRFHYADAPFGDGIVGLFLDEGVSKGDLIAHIQDPRNPGLPGHLDLVEVAIYEDVSSWDKVIVEFVVRSPMPTPGEGTVFKYRAYFDDDLDQPFADGPDFFWQVNVGAGNEYTTRHGASRPVVDESRRRVSFLVDLGEFGGTSGAVAADAFQEDNGSRVHRNGWTSSTTLEFPEAKPADLSRSDSRSSRRQNEVFHHQSPPDLEEIACRIIGVLGDEFDLFVFHNEFPVDRQNLGTPGNGQRADVKGIGVEHRNRTPACGSGRLKRHWQLPVSMRSRSVLDKSAHGGTDAHDKGLALFAHEFTHAWTAHLSYLRDGEREPLFGNFCACHWRFDLHTPAAFPWRGTEVPSIMAGGGGRYWRDNGDGTYTSIANYWGSGPSWLDLYAMGLASADEVPDMFILRDLESVDGQGYCRRGRYCDGAVWTGDKEIVSIDQVVAAEGPRIPSALDAQRDFNAGFVYLLEPGQAPDPDLLRLHAEYRAKVIEHWSHVTGGRSRMTTTVPDVANRSPVALGTLPDHAVGVGGGVVVDAGAAFRDPDGDPLTYEAVSSAPAVASVEVSGSTVTVRAVSAGIATVTVTATDISGSNTTATLAFRVTVGGLPSTTFTDDPILPGVTTVKAVHFTELRERIDLLRDGAGLAPFAWTDPVLTAGVTPVRLSHLLELREALAAAYRASGRAGPVFTDATPMSETTPIRAMHLMELRAAVVALQ